jgi:protein SCO1/2
MLLLLPACASAPTLKGTDLESAPAPDFTLSDQDGSPFKLSAQKGRAVVLTFLYTNCPTECPLIAERMREARDLLGGDAAGVRWVAVSLDPVNDTGEAVARFLKAHRVEGQLTYLRGAREELAPVWKAYYLAVLPGAQPGALSHQSRVIVIDRDGKQRSNFGADVSAEALANDVRVVLR